MRTWRNIGLVACVILLTLSVYEGAGHRLIPAARTGAISTLLEGGAPDILRLHVVANSDSDEDQRVKLLVRDALIAQFAPAGSKAAAEQVLLREGGGVLETVKSVLAREGFTYGAQLKLGVMEFPDRTYGDTPFPAGEYEALRVELGAAQGKNWWCVLFPPLCLVDAGVQDIPGSDELVFESDIAQWIRQWRDNA